MFIFNSLVLMNMNLNLKHVWQATVGSHQRFYITSQSPLPSTLTCFWQMVWEADVYLVISLLDDPSIHTSYCPSSICNDRCLEFGEVCIIQYCNKTTFVCCPIGRQLKP